MTHTKCEEIPIYVQTFRMRRLAIGIEKILAFDTNGYMQGLKFQIEIPESPRKQLSRMKFSDFSIFFMILFKIYLNSGKNC